MRKHIFVLLFSLIIAITASAQSFLVLEKMGTKKRFEFHLGEQIEVILDDDNFYTRINIVGLGDSIIVTEYENVSLSSITAVHLTGTKKYLNNWGPPLMVAGVILFAIDIINQTTGISSGEYSPSPAITAASVSLFGLGTILTLTGRRKIKMKNWWRLRIVQI